MCLVKQLSHLPNNHWILSIHSSTKLTSNIVTIRSVSDILWLLHFWVSLVFVKCRPSFFVYFATLGLYRFVTSVNWPTVVVLISPVYCLVIRQWVCVGIAPVCLGVAVAVCPLSPVYLALKVCYTGLDIWPQWGLRSAFPARFSTICTSH